MGITACGKTGYGYNWLWKELVMGSLAMDITAYGKTGYGNNWLLG